ncbi:hypothetical protein AAJCM20276_21210 [Acetobacter aceti]|uniref:Uncharacterized protein n=1 Tax=Acetobacter aceti TaxID=435 RepID=A0A6S6PEY9_ACEAC|nr:hypothetical protein AAJCM20276_21210 [Acetobacter aceti]
MLPVCLNVQATIITRWPLQRIPNIAALLTMRMGLIAAWSEGAFSFR